MLNTPTASSYARIVQQMCYPTKDQAIVINSVEGVSVQDYLLAMATVVDKSDIRYISKISHGRVCLYLSSKEIADKLTDNHIKLKINNHSLEIRPLLSKSKRIILSNVCPIIPSSIIEEELLKHGIKPTSQITAIRAAGSLTGFTHVLSFRRQMYLTGEDEQKMPASISINYDGTNYWIYLSSEKLTCFSCKQEGHLAKHCRNVNTDSQELPNSQVTAATQHSLNDKSKPEFSSNVPGEKDNDMVESASKEDTEMDIAVSTSVFKRPRASTTTTSSVREVNEDAERSINKSKQITKKVKTADSEVNSVTSVRDTVTQLQVAREMIISNSEKYPLDFDSVSKFIADTYGNYNVVEIAESYTNNFASLVLMLSDIYTLVTDSNIKRRITRIKKHLNKSITSKEKYIDDNISELSSTDESLNLN